jgi:MerR family transcriptional regulator, heat shock protein HspR
MTPRDPINQYKAPLLFTRTVAAQLARVSLDFLELLEAEDLIRPRQLEGGETGYAPEDIGRLSRMRRLHETLGLDLASLEVVLHLRERLVSVLAQMEDLEARFARREQELLLELNELRRRFLITR